MKEMNEELISAYLDDELSPQEREDVERALTQNAALRQLKDELQALRDDFDSLPVYHHRDLELVVSSIVGESPPPAAIVRPTSAPTANKTSLWIPIAFGLAACLLAVITLLPDRNSESEQLTMSVADQANQHEPGEQESDAVHSEGQFALSKEAAMGGGMAGAITASDTPGDLDSNGGFGQANQPSAEASEEGLERAMADNNVDAMANLIVQSRMAPDHTIALTVSRDQLESLLAIIDPPAGSKPSPPAGSRIEKSAGAPFQSQRNVRPAEASNQNADFRSQTKRRAIAYAIEQTPEELTNVLAQLEVQRQRKYRFANEDEDLAEQRTQENNDSLDKKPTPKQLEKAKLQVAKLADAKPDGKLNVLFLITLTPSNAFEKGEPADTVPLPNDK